MQTLVHDLLVAWREAEGVALGLTLGSPEQLKASDVAAFLRVIYFQVTDGEDRESEVPAIRAVLAEIRAQLPTPAAILS